MRSLFLLLVLVGLATTSIAGVKLQFGNGPTIDVEGTVDIPTGRVRGPIRVKPAPRTRVVHIEDEESGDEEYIVVRRQRGPLPCAGSNFHGKFAEGGGCNFHGCWAPGGSCNFHGCTKTGVCEFNGCPQKTESYKCAE